MFNDKKSSHKSTVKSFHISWKNSLLFRSAILAFSLILAAYSINVLMSIQAIDSLSPLIHDQKVEYALEQYRNKIKDSWKVKQKLISNRIDPYIRAWISAKYPSLSKIVIASWFNTATEGLLPPTDENKIKLINESSANEYKEPFTEWYDKDKIRIFNYSIDLSPLPEIESFVTATKTHTKYKLIGSQLRQQIIPAVIYANSIILFLNFLILSLGFFFLARSLKKQLFEILDGLYEWSRGNESFRFEGKLKGELGLIARRFNIMAGNIRSEREKTMHLEKIASWQEIAKKMAHEIKNPLTPIKMMVAQLARKYSGDDKEYNTLLIDARDIISEEIANLTRLVDHFSHFARLPIPELKKTNLVQMILAVIELERAAYPQHVIEYKAKYKNFTAMLDEALIKQVLLNLIKNACQVSTQTLYISVDIEEDHDHFKIFITDNGPGIPELEQKHVFEAYFTSKRDQYSAMGLGLTICQKIILDHEGTLSLESIPGQTKFIVSLPKKNDILQALAKEAL